MDLTVCPSDMIPVPRGTDEKIQLKPMPVIACNCIKVKQNESLSLLHCLIHKGADLNLSLCVLFQYVIQSHSTENTYCMPVKTSLLQFYCISFEISLQFYCISMNFFFFIMNN